MGRAMINEDFMTKLIFSFAFVLVITGGAYAWGVQGHRIVGEIAENYLTPKAKKEIKAILGNESLAMCSNWPDFIKSDTAFSYFSPWHYINIPGGQTKNSFYGLLETDTAVDAWTKINFLKSALKSKALPSEIKAQYLKLLVHIVGDIHQPLHVGRPDDRGGNSIKVSWFGESSNLHQVWDDKLINFQLLSYTEYVAAINFTTAAQRREWQNEPVKDWFYQSYLLAENIYRDVRADDKLGYLYNYKYISTVNSQLLKGGVRLAGLLNEIFR